MRMIFSDRDLAKRLERTEARSNVDFVKARAEMFPESGAEWMDFQKITMILFRFISTTELFCNV